MEWLKLFQSAIESEFIFQNCVHDLVIYIFWDAIQAKSVSVEIFWSQGFGEEL